MKKWQLGICVTCAAVLAGMFLFSSGAQAAGVAHADATGPVVVRSDVSILDVQPIAATRYAWQQPVTNNLLTTVAAEVRETGVRMARDAAAMLQQGVPAIELPGHEAPRPRPALTPALVTAE